MRFHGLNVWAVLVAAISAFALGGLWYAPFLFGGAWKKANGFGADGPPPAGAKVFVISFILSLVMALNLAMFLNDPKTNLAWGATAGFLAGFGWVAMGSGIVSVFVQGRWRCVVVGGGPVSVGRLSVLALR